SGLVGAPTLWVCNSQMGITTALQIRHHQRAKIHVHQPSTRRLVRRSSLRFGTAQFSELPTNTDNSVSSGPRRLFFLCFKDGIRLYISPACGKKCGSFKGSGSSASKRTHHKQLNRANL